MSLYCVALVFFFSGALISLLAGRKAGAVYLGPGFAIVGAVLGFIGLLFGWTAAPESIQLDLPLPIGSPILTLDSLARFFLVPVYVLVLLCAVYGASYLTAYQGRKNLGAHWCFFNLLAAGMALVPAAGDGFFFLLCWEFMSLAPFFLVSFYDEKPEVREASWVYLVAAHLGAVALMVAMILLERNAGSFHFAAFASAAPRFSGAVANSVFILAVFGFGAKAGLVPLHIWLPEAHPAAPSHVSAIMSGALVNAGVYGICRMVGFLGPVQSWWGPSLLLLGLFTAAYGILGALVQQDGKRLLALSTVENMGIVFVGLGAWLIGQFAGQPSVALLGLVGALLHVWNHAVFKGLLFLGAGVVLKRTGTVALDRLGGLARRMPLTASCCGVGSAAIAGLPPLNGFVGEFCIFLALAQGLAVGTSFGKLLLLLAFVGLSCVGGLAVACFARVYGMIFLGEPRDRSIACSGEAEPALLAPMLLLAALCLSGGVAASILLDAALRAAGTVLPLTDAENAVGLLLARQAVEGIALIAGVLLGVFVVAVAIRRLLPGSRRVRRFRTWDCGYAATTERMQYSPASFAAPLAGLFGPLSGLQRQIKGIQGLFPSKGEVSSATPDPAFRLLIAPGFEAVRRVCDSLKWLQHGRIHLYILYMLGTLVALLIWKL